MPREPRIPASVATLLSSFKNSDAIAACACHDSSAVFETDDRQYTGEFDGVISVRLGKPSVSKASSLKVPLHIVGYSTQSQIKGLGATSLDFDYSRPVRPSELTGDLKTFFPAVQVMRLNILMTAEGLGNVTLRSMNPGTLVNGKANAFPPSPGATYVLQRAVELEDVKRPGKVKARLVSVNTSITSTDIALKEVNIGSGVHFYLHDTEEENPTLRFKLPREAKVAVKVFTARGVEVATLLQGVMPSGTHKVNVDRTRLKGKTLYYQLFLNGKASSALMPL